LPLEESQELGGIVADLLTDGHLAGRSIGGRMHCDYISFFSEETRELEAFNSRIKKLFGVSGNVVYWGRRFNGRSKGVIICNSVLERILSLCGVPLGAKVSAAFEVPEWMRRADKMTKAVFLRRLFNCDGTIGYDKYCKRWFIRFETAKLLRLEKNGEEFISQIRKMLAEFGIESVMTRSLPPRRRPESEDRVALAVKIYKPDSIIRFSEAIGFDSEHKKQRMIKAEAWARQRRRMLKKASF